MNRVVHFEIHATDPERAARFYGEVFGWDIKEWTIPGVEVSPENRYRLVGTGPQDARGIDGGLMFRRGDAPVAAANAGTVIPLSGERCMQANAARRYRRRAVAGTSLQEDALYSLYSVCSAD